MSSPKASFCLSFRRETRPQEQEIEFWEGEVFPEEILPGSPQWQRYRLHNTANIMHVAEKLDLTAEKEKKYKVAWIGACVLYDRNKLLDCGGFGFWKDLPPDHAGEDVLAQLKVMKKYGGFGLIPSGVYHQELPTTVDNRNINAPEYL